MRKTGTSLCVIAATICTVVVLFVLPITPKIPISTTRIETGSLVRARSAEGLIGYAGETGCVALTAGQVAQVYVVQGQTVREGEMLARLDSSTEESALAELQQLLYRQEQTIIATGEGQALAQAAFTQNTLSLRTQAEEYKAMAKSKILRAEADGVVGQVYAREGGYVGALSPLMTLHGKEMEITVAQRVQDVLSLAQGMRGVVMEGNNACAVVQLNSFDAPLAADVTGGLYQTLRFGVMEGQDWLEQRVGETVALDILWDVQQDAALAPIAAVSSAGQIWVVRDQRAYSVNVDTTRRDEDFVSVSDSLAGETVVLLPDETPLYQGCMVKESGKK